MYTNSEKDLNTEINKDSDIKESFEDLTQFIDFYKSTQQQNKNVDLDCKQSLIKHMEFELNKIKQMTQNCDFNKQEVVQKGHEVKEDKHEVQKVETTQIEIESNANLYETTNTN